MSQSMTTYNGTATYPTISEAVAALSPSAAASIFVFPGSQLIVHSVYVMAVQSQLTRCYIAYEEQVVIDREYPTTISGHTADRRGFASNEVVITNSLVASVAGSDDASGTVRAESANIALYNLNISNTYG